MYKSSILFSILMMCMALSNAVADEDIFDDYRYGVSESAPVEKKTGTPITDFAVVQPLTQTKQLLYEYHLGPLDLIEVDVFGAAELGRVSRVNTAGFVSLPLIGGVKVAGLTVPEAERKIEEILGEKYMQDPHVTVFIKEYESQKITVEGWVKNPGVFPLKGKTTFLQAIANAKGMDRFAEFSEVAVFRTDEKGTTGYILSYTKVRAGEQVDPVLQNGDIIVVNRSGAKAGWAAVVSTLNSFIGWSILF